MKKRLLLASFVCLTCALVMLVGCSGGENTTNEPSLTDPSESKFKVTPDIDTFKLGAWDVEITNAEVLFDEANGCDNLVIYTKATNTVDKELKYEPNIVAKQNDDIVGRGNIVGADGKLLLTSSDDLPLCKNGESCEMVIPLEIEDYEAPIVVNFGGYTVAVEDTIVTFNVSGKQTDEAKKVADELQAEEEKKKSISSVEFDQADVTIPAGWMVETSSSVSCQIKPVDGTGYVRIETNKTRTAAEARDALNGNYKGEKPLDEVEINGVTWLRLTVNDTQSYLFADAPSGGSVSMSSMHHTFDQALPVFESVVLK